MKSKQFAFVLSIFLCTFSACAISKDSPDGQNPVKKEQPQHESVKNNSDKKVVSPTKVEESKSSACCNQEPKENWWEKLGTDPVATFTALLFLVTGGLVYLGIRQEEATRTIARAYVKMSHEAPGLRWFEEDGGFLLVIKIQNFGNTPADITDVLFSPNILEPTEELPKTPDYKRQRSMFSFHAVLVKDEFFIYNNPEIFTVGEDKSAIERGRKRLIVKGYVDYIDGFGIRRRAGYAREFNPRAGNTVVIGENGTPKNVAKNNLDLFTERGYNYDRKRKRGEGNDWV